ncbi:hypothetical protein BDC45DRAFT_431226 [Circinella umbellata]|nr:hypothetical protein BDC45DRAFT_431226 [Circinella umbellata]
MAILPINIPFSLTDPPWKPASGPQSSVGGPIVYSHTAFVGGPNGGNMIVLGGVMPTTEKSNSDDESIAYSYDCDIGRWNTFSLPTQNYLNRQGAASSISSNGIAHIWGGKRASLSGAAPSSSSSTTTYAATMTTTAVKPRLPATIYQIDSLYPSNSTMSPVVSSLPPLRYGHTQTLINDKTIVILGGFDSLTGDSLSLADIWLYDIPTLTWTHKFAALHKDNKPANRSSHSQVLMPDGSSILMQWLIQCHRYGGYDGYHVYNDVAVLDTRTWSWTIKNTNAAVQGRADVSLNFQVVMEIRDKTKVYGGGL